MFRGCKRGASFDCIRTFVPTNPCRCGYYPDMQKCRCSQKMISGYLNRVSQPLLDRIDICVHAEALSYPELTGQQQNESSAQIRSRVCRCHELQAERFQGEGFLHNSRIPASRIREFCPLGVQEQKYMEQVYNEMEMTGRTYHKILRVARTIADLEESRMITCRHLSEAVCYRSIDRNYWGGLQ